MKRYSEDAWERAMKVQDLILRAMAKPIIRLSGPPRFSASRIGVCGAGGSGTRSTATTGCWTGDGASPAPGGWRWRPWKKCCGSTRKNTRTCRRGGRHFHEKLVEEHAIRLGST
jgi:hypothetical protein